MAAVGEVMINVVGEEAIAAAEMTEAAAVLVEMAETLAVETELVGPIPTPTKYLIRSFVRQPILNETG